MLSLSVFFVPLAAESFFSGIFGGNRALCFDSVSSFCTLYSSPANLSGLYF